MISKPHSDWCMNGECCHVSLLSFIYRLRTVFFICFRLTVCVEISNTVKSQIFVEYQFLWISWANRSMNSKPSRNVLLNIPVILFKKIQNHEN